VIRTVVKAFVIGAVTGPPIALLWSWVAGTLSVNAAHPVIWLLKSAFIGVAYTVCFTILCALPLRYLREKISGRQAWQRGVAMVLAAFSLGSLAFSVVAVILSGTLGMPFDGPLPLEKAAAMAGLYATVMGLIITSNFRLKAERDAHAARAEAAALAAQIRPHFLFNTLNAISAQVNLDPAAAQENLGRLADMFRYTLKHARQELVPLADEIELAREYLLLEKARFGDRLSFELPTPVEASLPGLTLQPLVENAVRHGIARLAPGGCVHVSLERSAKDWILKVRNPTLRNGMLADHELFRDGHALWILKKRLPSLTVRQEPEEFEVEVRLS